MKKVWILIGIAVVCVSFFFLGGCAQEFECEIWQYASGSWNYYTWDVYTGKDAADAEANCEDDWSSSYDCRNCVPY